MHRPRLHICQSKMASSKEYILPSSLPVLVLKRHVLLPGGSLVLRVEDTKGYVTDSVSIFLLNLCLLVHSVRMIEECLWEERNWSSKFIGVVPFQSGTKKVMQDIVNVSADRLYLYS